MFSGLVFLGLGGVFVTGRVDVTDVDSQWLWPLPLILAGLFIFLAAFRREPEAAADYAPVDGTADVRAGQEEVRANQEEVMGDETPKAEDEASPGSFEEQLDSTDGTGSDEGTST